MRRFWEKPSPQIARDLFERGCIWNTFVMVGRVQAFLDIIRHAAPELYETFEELGPDITEETLQSIYEHLPPADFSKLVLSGAAANNLGVFSLGDVGWTDLGGPRRVTTILAGNESRKQMNWTTLTNLLFLSFRGRSGDGEQVANTAPFGRRPRACARSGVLKHESDSIEESRFTGLPLQFSRPA